jgi:hypothetical protein
MYMCQNMYIRENIYKTVHTKITMYTIYIHKMKMRKVYIGEKIVNIFDFIRNICYTTHMHKKYTSMK